MTTALKFLRPRDPGEFPEYTIRSVEEALARAGMVSVANEPSNLVSLTGRILSRARLVRTVVRLRSTAFFVPLMGPAERRLFPASYVFEIVPYVFDCWPKDYARWRGIFSRNEVRVAFFSASQSMEYFADLFPAMDCMWVPEATDPSRYAHDTPLAARGIDVLELGRRHGAFHDALVRGLKGHQLVHRFERAPGEIIFATRRDLIAGLEDTKVSILFPSSITHPRRSANVETLTHKYLESMASRCVLLGRCPRELEQLFGYNPVVEADFGDPGAQVRQILDNIDAYQWAVDANYARLLEVGTWDQRVAWMLEQLSQRGYVLSNGG